MCSINHNLKAIYIHIPKNAGLYVKKVLEKHYGFITFSLIHEDHDEFVDEYEPFHDPEIGWISIRKKGMLNYYMSSKIHDKEMKITKAQWDSYFKFTFVRNPYEKVVSAWKFAMETDKLFKFPPVFSLLDFLKTKDTTTNYTYTHGFITQTDHLLNLEDKLDIQYIGKFEDLNEELCNVLFKLGIKKITHYGMIKGNFVVNLRKGKKTSYDRYYNQEALELANELFKDDFANFHYKKCETIEELQEDSKKYYCDEELFVEKNKLLLEKLQKEGKTIM